MYRKQVRRRRAVLALLVIGGFVLLTITYGRGSNGLQSGVSTIFSPIESVADRALKPARDLINWFDKTFDARGENSKLQAELEASRELAVGAQAALAENRELRKLLDLDASGAIPGGYSPVTGRVIARSPTEWNSDVIIDVGSGNGVSVDDPVVNGDGLVGAVTAVTGGTAKVTLIADNSSAVSAKVVPGAIQGVIKPSLGDPGDLILDFIDSTEAGRRRPHRGHRRLALARPLLGLPAEPADRRSDQGLARRAGGPAAGPREALRRPPQPRPGPGFD